MKVTSRTKIYLFAGTLIFLSVACSTSKEGSRKIAVLDNNGDIVDDSFDPHLETYYGGSKTTETAANDAVASVIKNFIQSQQQVRHEEEHSSSAQSPEAKRIFSDLPKPDYATRDVHRKTNGCLKAELNIASDLKERLNAQIASYGNPELTPITNESDLGIFAPGRSYDAVVRLSNGHPGNRPDKLADARGFAVKLLPPGTLTERTIANSNATDLNKATALDILSINFPTFFVNDPIKYAEFNKVALDSSMDFKNKFEAEAEQFWAVVGAGQLTSLERKLALWVNGSVIYSPFYQEYFSMVPSRLGPEGAIRAVKYSWKPVACSDSEDKAFESEKAVQWAPWTTDHTYALPPSVPEEVKNPSSPFSAADFPDDYLRAHVADRITQGDFCFDLYFQLYRDSVSTNIEDSTDLWARDDSEKSWWAKSVVPSKVLWNTDLHNYEPRKSYMQRFMTKKTAPQVFAGKLTIKQVAKEDYNSVAANNKTCEDLSFNPWNGDIAHHKPLGIVSRMKRKVYNASRRERHGLNGIDDKNIERH